MKFKFHQNLTRITGISHLDLRTFMINLPQFFLKWKIFQTKVADKIKTHILCSITFSENHAANKIMWKNIVELDRPPMTICRTWIARWVPKATNTHSEYVIHIAFPQQQWLRERASILGYSTLPVVCLLRNLQSGSEPHTQLPIEWPSLELPPGGKQPGSQANYSPHNPVQRIQTHGAVPPFPIRLYDMVLT